MKRTALNLAAPAIVATLLAVSLAGCTPRPYPQALVPAPETGNVEAAQNQQSEQRDALERYAEAERVQVEAFMVATPGLYSDIQVDAVFPDSIAFTYTYAAQVDPVAAVSHFDAVAPSLESICDTTVFPAMKATGVTGTMYVSYKYLNADGTEIWHRAFKSS